MEISQEDVRTRSRVQSTLLARGGATAADLAAELGLSAAAVRRHLDALLSDGTVVEQPRRGPRPGVVRRGRPARHYTLSDRGHERGPQAYDALATEALTFLDESGGVEAFAARRAQRMAAGYAAAGVVNVEALAAALTQDGYAATVHQVGSGVQLCQHHCPVAHVAAAYPQLCEAETAALGQLVGRHVQRLATIAHGDGVCTTHVPAAGGTAAAGTPDRSAGAAGVPQPAVRSAATRRVAAAGTTAGFAGPGAPPPTDPRTAGRQPDDRPTADHRNDRRTADSRALPTLQQR